MLNLCVIAFFVLYPSNRVNCYSSEDIKKCGKVHVSVSSLKDTYLELNWVTDCDRPDDIAPEYIIFSEKDPRDRSEDSTILKIRASDYPHGYYRTRKKFWLPWLPGNWEYTESNTKADPGSHCFPYWVASIKGSYIIDARCLAIEPTWMNDNRQSIGSQKIGNLFIPGTHNSGSYSGLPAFIEDYVLNQDKNIWTQLVFGIRYLDFRIGYYEHEGFFINHDLVRVTKIEPIFRQIRKFVQMAPLEVIVVDFHRFPYPSNFTQDMHRKFIDLVYDYLGDLVLPPGGLQVGKGPSLNEIWAQDKNIIICYADKTTVRNNHWLWHPVQQYWGNTKKTSQLKNFLLNSIKDHRVTMNPMWALMAELTPQPLDIIFRINNLRKLADDANKHVTKWFRDEWWTQANVVATDYFLGNDIIHVAIDANINK